MFRSELEVRPRIWIPLGFPGGSDSEESVFKAGDLGSIPGMAWSLGERNDNLLQYSHLENPVQGGAWQAIWGRRVGYDWVISLFPPDSTNLLIMIKLLKFYF